VNNLNLWAKKFILKTQKTLSSTDWIVVMPLKLIRKRNYGPSTQIASPTIWKRVWNWGNQNGSKLPTFSYCQKSVLWTFNMHEAQSKAFFNVELYTRSHYSCSVAMNFLRFIMDNSACTKSNTLGMLAGFETVAWMKKSDSYHLGVLLFVYILKFHCNMK